MARTYTAPLTALLLGLALGGTAGAAPSTDELLRRIEALEDNHRELDQALASDRLSNQEPVDALNISASVGLVMVAQGASSNSTASGDGESQLNYRGDVAITLPGGDVGRASGSLFAHLRVGQGAGLADRNASFGAPNATSFVTASGEANPVLAQVWYKTDVPLGDDGTAPRLEITVGKMDPFLFFDQNAIADDETSGFMNTLLVHNPLLDAGGDAGVGSDGASPGLRVAYRREAGTSQWWQLSLGLFSAGTGSDFDRGFTAPFVIAQLDVGRTFVGGLDGNYRLYGWSNGQARDFAADAERHAGWGVSLDQRLGETTTVFGRYGASTAGQVAFDRALTVGAELAGGYWDRADDGLGLAVAALQSSADYRAAHPQCDASEQTLEIYYRWRLNRQVSITPSLQRVNNPAGDARAPAMDLIGLRSSVVF